MAALITSSRSHRMSFNNSILEPYDIDDDDDDDDIGFDGGHINNQDEELRQTVRGLVRRRNEFGRRDRRLPQSPRNYIDLDALLENEDFAGDVAEYIDLTADEAPSRSAPRRSLSTPARNLPLGVSRIELPSYVCSSGFVLKPGAFIELSSAVIADLRFTVPLRFLLIKSIIKDTSAGYGKVTVRGWPFARTREFGGQLHHKLNEVCLLYEIDDDDGRPPDEQALLEVDVHSNTFIRRELRRTNVSFPAHRFSIIYKSNGQPDWQRVEDEGVLVCRWRYYIYYRDASKRRQRRPREWALVHAQYKDADPGFRILDDVRVNNWRGGRTRGGSYIPNSPYRGGAAAPVAVVADDDHVVIDLDDHSQPPRQIDQQPGQAYTFGDMFCGAGGASRGAEMAGFRLSLAVDHWDAACSSYRANFATSDLYEKDVYDFVTTANHRRGGAHSIDVVHLSPPCQVWSPAHTIPGQNDEANMASLFACHDLIKKLRPRLFTLEQTFGILFPGFTPYFNAMLQGFTTLNYSVRWRVVDLDTWGLPQARKRLVMVGAGPGENLPTFPKATHGDGAAIPRVSVLRALSTIGPGTTLHDVPSAARRDLPPWDPGTTLPYTITCSGGQNYHYSGTRDFTLREFACLQGFPVSHQFRAPGIRKQIGNAFPPCVVRVLYDHLRRWLEAEDRVKPAPLASRSRAAASVAVVTPSPRGSSNSNGGSGSGGGCALRRPHRQPSRTEMDIVILDSPSPSPPPPTRSDAMLSFFIPDDVMWIDGDSDDEDQESMASSVTMADVPVVDLTVEFIGDDEL